MNYSLSEQPILQALGGDTQTLLFFLNIDGKITDIYPGFTAQTGFSREEVQQKYIWELFLSAGHQIDSNFFQEAFNASHLMTHAHFWLHKNKKSVFIEWSGAPFTDTAQGTSGFICTGKNLSRYKSIEATLKVKEHKLEQLQRISKTGYWEHDLLANTVSISSQTAEIYDITYTKEPIPGNIRQFNFLQKPYLLDEIYNLVIESEKEEFKATLHQIMEARQPFQWSYTVEVGGVKKRIYAEGEFVFDQAGTPVRLVGITQDITQKFEDEQKLKYKEKLLDTLSDAVISTDTACIITSWNKGAEKTYGWTAAEAIGKNVDDLLQTTYMAGFLRGNELKQEAEREDQVNRVMHTKKNGHRIYIASVVSKVLDDKTRHVGFVKVNRNISELVKIEENLLKNQANLIAVLENTPDSVYVVDTDFAIMIMNSNCRENFYKRFGITISNGDKINSKLPAPVATSVETTLTKALAGEKFTFEATYTDLHGEEQSIETTVSPIKNEISQIIGIVVYSRNITERKKIQQQILNLKIESERIQAAALLEGQDIERKRMLKELHDGIGQMLHILKLKTEVLQDEFSQIKHPLEELTRLINHTIAEVKALIYDFIPFTLENLGLEGAIRALVEQYKFNTKLHIQFQLWLNLKNVRFNTTLETYIYRILQECLNNIAKHAHAKHVTIQLTQLTESLLLMVEDDGTGFDLEEKLKQKTDSSGLKNLIERCKLISAQIDIDTQPGHGCTINIMFSI